MQMTEWNQKNAMEHCGAVEPLTEEELQNEYDAFVTDKLLKTMLEGGLLPDGAYAEIKRKNLEKFSPLLGRII